MTNQTLSPVRVAIYARVSSEEQREGQTIDSQIAELERFADAQGWLLADMYKDEGWSGGVLARPELDRLRDDAAKQLFDIALFNDVDRLARDVSHLGVIKRDLERKGIQVRFRKLPADQSPTANLMVNILGSFAEFEREMIVDRTRRGRRHKVEVRQQFLGSIAPYGYRYSRKDRAQNKDGQLETLPEQASIVRQMFQWVDTEGLSARKVVKRLNELGIPPSKAGESWGKSTVLRILRCETYTGVWYYNKQESYAPPAGKQQPYRRSVKYKHRWRPRADWIGVKLPDQLRIIDQAQWERVQSQLNRNRCFSKRNSRHLYILKGLVECGGCQARYVGDPNHGRYYYRCYQRCKRYSSIREEVLSQTVWEAIKEVILNPKIVMQQAELRAQEAATNAAFSKNEEQAITQGMGKLAEEERRILEAYRTGIITPAILGRELDQLKTRRTTLVQRLAKLKTQSQQPAMPVISRGVTEYCQTAAKRLGELTDVERQRLLQLLIKTVVYQGNEITIKGIIPLQTAPNQEALEVEIADTGTSSSLIDGVVDSDVYTLVRNPVSENSSDRIETTAVAAAGHNSVNEISFNLTKNLPRVRRVWNAERFRLLRQLVQLQPQATLKELCEQIQQQHNIAVGISSMYRAIKRLNLARNGQGSHSR